MITQWRLLPAIAADSPVGATILAGENRPGNQPLQDGDLLLLDDFGPYGYVMCLIGNGTEGPVMVKLADDDTWA
jgi:hypothetical protein